MTRTYTHPYLLLAPTLFFLTVLCTTQIISAWTGPTSTPPNANADAPLNIGSTSQTKLGALGAYGLFLTGTSPQYINFSSTLGSTGFGLRNNGGTIEYKNSGGSWSTLGSSQWTTSGSNIYYNTGDVRIGSTDSPEEKLHVTGNILQDNSNTLRAKNSAGTVETWMWPRWVDNATYMNMGNGGLFIRSNSGAHRFTITSTGLVGVGSDTTPDFQFELNGTGTYDRKIGINDIQVIYLPDHSASGFTGSIALGNGLPALSHTTGTQGYYNTAIGYDTLIANTTGSGNTAAGLQALYKNTIGTNNSAFGVNALYNNISGAFNSAFGDSALYNNIGNSNVAVGRQAMYQNTSGSANTSVGSGALFTNTTSSANSAFGYNSLYLLNGSGYQNTAIGYQAGYDVSSGNNNTIVGHNTGRGITTGHQNTVIGANITGLAPDTSNNVIVSDGAGTIRMQVSSLGNTTFSGCLIYNGGSIGTCLSDARLKKDIKPFTLGLQNLLGLHPVYYKYTGDAETPDDNVSRLGFVAQDTLMHAPDFVRSPQTSSNDSGYIEVDYTAVSFAVLNAVKEIGSIGASFKKKLNAWIGSPNNGIEYVFAKQLCLDDDTGQPVCIDAEQLRVILTGIKK